MYKKKHKNKHSDIFRNASEVKLKSKKSLNHDFKQALKDIEGYQMSMYEAEKKDRKRARKAINNDAKDFYYEIHGIKCRKKLSKKWEKTGFLDTIIELLNEVSPLLKQLARLVSTMIVAFLSIDSIQKIISPKIVKKLSFIFDLAQSV